MGRARTGPGISERVRATSTVDGCNLCPSLPSSVRSSEVARCEHGALPAAGCIGAESSFKVRCGLRSVRTRHVATLFSPVSADRHDRLVCLELLHTSSSEKLRNQPKQHDPRAWTFASVAHRCKLCVPVVSRLMSANVKHSKKCSKPWSPRVVSFQS